MAKKSDIAEGLLLDDDNASYDRAAKRLLSMKPLLAWILKYLVAEFKEPLINSATHLHASELSSRRRQILDVAPLRLRFVSSIDTAHLRKSGRLHFISVSSNSSTRMLWFV